MKESLLHSAFRYNDFALIERLRQRPGYEESLFEKNSEGETPIDIAFIRGTLIQFIPVENILRRISEVSGNYESVLLSFLEKEQGDFPRDDLSCKWPEALLESLIRTAIKNRLHSHIPFNLLADDKDWQVYAALQKIEGNDLANLPENLCHPDLWSRPTHFGSLYHAAARKGILQKIPHGLLTRESLLLRDSKGKTPVHILASTRSGSALGALFRKISWPFDWQVQDDAGNTIFHEAAMAGVLTDLPSESLTSATMSVVRKDGCNPVDLAHKNHHMNSVPERFRYHSREYTKDRLMESLISGNWAEVPERLHEPAIVAKIVGTLPRDAMYLHLAARNGNLQSVPQKLIDFDLLRTPDNEENTPLHLTASVGKLHLMAPERLDPETLIMQNKSGLNIVDLAFESNEISFLHPSVQQLSLLFRKSCLLNVIRNNAAPVEHFFSSTDLLQSPAPDSNHATFAHWLASEERLADFPATILNESVLGNQDTDGNTPLHFLATSGHLEKLPRDILSQSLLLLPNHDGITSFHLGVTQKGFRGISIGLFSREVLLTKDNQGRSVADVVEEFGNTPLLPPNLRNLSRNGALVLLGKCFSTDFLSAANFHARELADLLPLEQFQLLRRKFVRDWSNQNPDLALDEEQAEAVAEYGSHIQVTARAGSGKTRTLVARALFQITHCRIPPSSLLILAFNKKAVGEIKKRLGEFLSEEQMPHILTFHALAHRIVRPQEDLIYDQGDTKEGQVFSTTIQRIIDEEMRGGLLEKELRDLMEMQWQGDLDQIIEGGFNLQPNEFLEFRSKLPKMTINGRRVRSEAQKHVANTLLRLGIRYSYRRTIHRFAGKVYAPDFSHYNKEKDSRIVFEVLESGALQSNPAREAFWRSDRASNTLLVQIPEDTCEDPQKISELIRESLKAHGVPAVPMSDDELWKAVRDRAISDFTKAVKQFISRCQKELITPDQLSLMITDGIEIQRKFWSLGAKIFARYLETLRTEQKTDFDQLMLNAAGMIGGGHTRFSSSRGSGNLSLIKHVLIDEFQDFSHLFNELRTAFIAQSPEALFFCVGDDWQAINKFAGSDLRYFTEFQKSFHPSTGTLISRNYRSCSRIVEAGNSVMSGEGSPSIANNDESGSIHIIDPNVVQFKYSEAEEIVVEELGELGEHSVSVLRIVSEQTSRGLKVAVLSRTGSISTPEGMLKLDRWKRKLRGFLPEENGKLLSVSTTHGFKGKEADVVIFLGPENYPTIHPNAIFNTIFGDTFESNVADEKRLFYVGVTRAKSALFLLRDLWDGNISRRSPGTFLAMIPNQLRYDIGSISAHLVCVGRVIIRLENKPGCPKAGGTYPLRDKLKAEGYKWSDENKAWSLFLEPGSISSPRECSLYLLNQEWIKEADGVIATFVWENQKHRMVIDGGRVTPEGSSSPLPESPRFEKKPEQTEPVDRIERTQPKSPPPSDAGRQPRQQTPAAPSTGVFETGIVGMKYGGGMEKARNISVGDFVRLQREPGNTHDGNAIQVMTLSGERIGYVSRYVASHLATGLDAWGGVSQAKVTSVWTQPPPNFLVSIQICFPLPPNVVIPRELDASAHLDDSPFGSAKPLTTKSAASTVPSTERAVPDPATPQPVNHPPHDVATESEQQDQEALGLSENLSPQQREELENLLDSRLSPLIAEMYLSGLSDWPEIGYEGKDANGICTGSMLEVAWLGSRIGIAMPANEFRSLTEAGWKILPAATVTASELRSLFSAEMTGIHPVDQSGAANPSIPTADSTGDFTDKNIHSRNGSFYDEEPDEDIPPF